MLNCFYGIFDNYIDKYDVYKVEMIGDVYMVVLGFLEKNGYCYVIEIFLMVLYLVEFMESFCFGFDGEWDFCVRIGIYIGE